MSKHVSWGFLPQMELLCIADGHFTLGKWWNSFPFKGHQYCSSVRTQLEAPTPGPCTHVFVESRLGLNESYELRVITWKRSGLAVRMAEKSEEGRTRCLQRGMGLRFERDVKLRSFEIDKKRSPRGGMNLEGSRVRKA